MTKQPDPVPRPEDTPEPEYEPPAAEELGTDPVETAPGFSF